MKKTFWCFMGVHAWRFFTSEHTFPKKEIFYLEGAEVFRKCVRCGKTQCLHDDGQTSGMASMEEWKTVKV